MRTTSNGLRWLGTQAVFISFLSVLALLAFMASTDSAGAATTFAPTGSACLDSEATVDPKPFETGDAGECDGNSAPGAATGITTSFNLKKGDVNFAGVISFTPTEWGIPKGDTIPFGAIAGTLNSNATLGLIGGACNTSLNVSFILLNSSINPADTVTFDDGFKDGDNDKMPDAVTKFPDFIARIVPGVTPRARLYGQTSVAGINVGINFVLFEPGTKIGAVTPDPKLGYPSVTFLQNTGDPIAVPAPSAITDFCSQLLSSTIINATTVDFPGTAANEGGVTYRTNPSAAGTYNFVTFAAGLRDPDGDGFENSLDPCPLTPDPSWDPRAGTSLTGQAGDADGDRIPDSCDKEPNSSPPSTDADSDGYLNTGDNCPQDANGTAGSNQKDSDSDGIGDECDIAGTGGIGKGPASADGDIKTTCVISQVQVGGGGAPSYDPMTVLPCGAAAPPGATATPTPTAATTTTTTTTTGGPGGAPSDGIGSLAPGGSSIALWAAIAAGLGGAGILGSLGAIGARLRGARRKRN